MAADIIAYLNRNESSPFFSKLVNEIKASKQNRAPATQWVGLLNGLTQKGVRTLELTDSTILDWLATKGPTSITKDELLHELDRRAVTIKEVQLGQTKFSHYTHKLGDYSEHLYIANSERDNLEDEIHRIDYEMEQLSFDLDRLADDPDIALRLAQERARLIAKKGGAHDFTNHHFSDVVTGKMGKNLVAHVRATVGDDGLYFVQEIQSDWAQKGRQTNASNVSNFDTGNIPKGPFVTDTEAWAGMVLRRHMQLAASNPKVNRFVWTRGFLRNGWMNQASRESDGLDDFYVKILPKIADKALKGTGAKVAFQKITTHGQEVDVPGFVITDQVREALKERKAMYSHANLMPTPRCINDPEAQSALRRAQEMLGSTKHVKLFDHVYDVSTGRRVAGRFVNMMAHVALDAKDITAAVDHECFHFACEHIMSDRERTVVVDAFKHGSRLNADVRRALLAQGMNEAAAQCINAEEAAAHGFTLWTRGQIEVKDPEVKGILGDVLSVIKDCTRWFKRVVLEQQLQKPEDIFNALISGELAHMQAMHVQERIPRQRA